MIPERFKAPLVVALLALTPAFVAVALLRSEPSATPPVPAVASYNDPQAEEAPVARQRGEQLAFHRAPQH